MPDYNSRNDPFPYPTAAEVDEAPGSRIDKAARNIVSARIQGIPRRAFLLGHNDKAPVVQSVREFISVVADLIDSIPPAELTGSLRAAVVEVEAMMMDHKCGDQVAPALKVD